MEEKKQFVTGDGNMNQDEADSMTGSRLIKITSVEQLRGLAEAAQARKSEADVLADHLMTQELASQIRQWRVDDGMSWRGVAGMLYAELKCKDHPEYGWFPPSNQLFGWAFCEKAAAALGEDPEMEPWN